METILLDKMPILQTRVAIVARAPPKEFHALAVLLLPDCPALATGDETVVDDLRNGFPFSMMRADKRGKERRVELAEFRTEPVSRNMSMRDAQ